MKHRIDDGESGIVSQRHRNSRLGALGAPIEEAKGLSELLNYARDGDTVIDGLGRSRSEVIRQGSPTPTGCLMPPRR